MGPDEWAQRFGLRSLPSECTPVCGDGIVSLGEQCDEGEYDGALPRCKVTRISGIMSATMAYDEKLAERVRAILAERHGVTEKRLMGTLAFMVNGAMCCSVSRDGLLVRIDAEEREQLLRDPFASPMKLGARTMNGFLRIALEGLRTRARLEKWIARGIARVEAGRKKGPSRRASSSTAHRRKA